MILTKNCCTIGKKKLFIEFFNSLVSHAGYKLSISLERFHEVLEVIFVRFLFKNFNQGFLEFDTLRQGLAYCVGIYGAQVSCAA